MRPRKQPPRLLLAAMVGSALETYGIDPAAVSPSSLANLLQGELKARGITLVYEGETAYSGDHDDFVNELLTDCPQEWDDDVAAESIVVNYLRELEKRCDRFGVSRLPYPEGEPDELIKLSDDLTRQLRRETGPTRVGLAEIRDGIDRAAGRDPWRHGDPPRPPDDGRA